MASSIPDVKAALVTIFQGALPGVTVRYGSKPPITSTVSKNLSVGRVAGVRDLDGMTLESVQERYTVECALAVNSRADAQTVTEEAMALYVAADAAVRLYPSGPGLGLGETVSAIPTGDFELNELEDETLQHSVVVFSVTVMAQIS